MGSSDAGLTLDGPIRTPDCDARKSAPKHDDHETPFSRRFAGRDDHGDADNENTDFKCRAGAPDGPVKNVVLPGGGAEYMGFAGRFGRDQSVGSGWVPEFCV